MASASKAVGIEDGRILVAIAPLFVGERVYSEMQEIVEAEFAPVELSLCGQDAIGRGRLCGKRERGGRARQI